MERPLVPAVPSPAVGHSPVCGRAAGDVGQADKLLPFDLNNAQPGNQLNVPDSGEHGVNEIGSLAADIGCTPTRFVARRLRWPSGTALQRPGQHLRLQRYGTSAAVRIVLRSVWRSASINR